MRRLDSSRYDAPVLWLKEDWLPKPVCTAKNSGQEDSAGCKWTALKDGVAGGNEKPRCRVRARPGENWRNHD